MDFELNAKKVVDHYYKSDNNIRDGAIIDECKKCYNSFFENYKIEFSHRQVNKVVDALAREVTFLTNYHLFIDVSPCI